MTDTPIPDSYWLLEDRLLAGEYPGASDENRARRKIEAILKAGIRSFIDLTETVDPLEPYEPILHERAASMGLEVSYRRMPIRDMSISVVVFGAQCLSSEANACFDAVSSKHSGRCRLRPPAT